MTKQRNPAAVAPLVLAGALGLAALACASTAHAQLCNPRHRPCAPSKPPTDPRQPQPTTPTPGGEVGAPLNPPDTSLHAPNDVRASRKSAGSVSIEWRSASSASTRGFLGFNVQRRKRLPGDTRQVAFPGKATLARAEQSIGSIRGNETYKWKTIQFVNPTIVTQGRRFQTEDYGLHGQEGYCYRVVAISKDHEAASGKTCVDERPGQLEATLRLLTHNIFGTRDDSCELRARTLGRHIAHASPAYDIVGVQEYYDNPIACDSAVFSNAIWSTNRYQAHDNYYRFYPDTDLWEPNADGGIGIFTAHPIREFDYWEWDGNKPGLKRLNADEGFVFSRVEIPGTGLSVDVYVVHLWSDMDGDRREDRREQLHKVAAKISLLSRDSGNPVLVMGDFNIGGPPTFHGHKGYDDIMRAFRTPRDVWHEFHRTGAGYTVDCIENATKSEDDASCDYQERLDYILVMTSRNFTRHPYDVVIKDARVVRQHLPSPGQRYFVSDHYGVEATLEFRK